MKRNPKISREHLAHSDRSKEWWEKKKREWGGICDDLDIGGGYVVRLPKRTTKAAPEGVEG